MYYKQIDVNCENIDNLSTELRYEIATAKVDGLQLLRINLCNNALEDSGYTKLIGGAIRLLKEMKREGRVQFIASKDSFEKNKTEAVFLINKYPELFPLEQNTNGCEFIYIKL